MPRTTVPHLEPIGMQWLMIVKKEDQRLNISLRKRWIVYLSSYWSRPAKSFPSNGFLGCPLGCLALWRLIRHDRGGSISFHQFLQWRCGRSYSWNRAWWLIIYRTPLPIQAQRIKFNVLKRSIRTVGGGIRQAFFLKRNSKLPLR